MKSLRATFRAIGLGLTLAATPALAEVPVHGGTLNFVLKYQPSTLSSINNTSTPLTSGKIFDGLLRFIPDGAARGVAFDTGEFDLGSSAHVALADLPRFEADSRYVVDTRSFAYSGQQHRLFFKLDTEVLKDRRVREAVAHAIDIQGIVDVVYFGRASSRRRPCRPR